MNKKYLPYLYTTVVCAIGLLLIANKQRGVGKMSDPEVALDNLKRGIANGWYTAQLTMVDGKQAVRLSGKLTDGTYYQDVYPISAEVAKELRMIGVKVAQ